MIQYILRTNLKFYKVNEVKQLFNWKFLLLPLNQNFNQVEIITLVVNVICFKAIDFKRVQAMQFHLMVAYIISQIFDTLISLVVITFLHCML